jgi:hypothetical protein
MALRLADRLSLERQRRFVGRYTELELFQRVSTAPTLPYHVLHIYGPGGIGKTTLLREFQHLGEQKGIATCYLDARTIEPVSDAVLRALSKALNLERHESPLDLLATCTHRLVVLVDTYETLAPLDAWFRDQFLPQISAEVLVVLAGRSQPDLAWRTDPGWQGLIQLLPLTNLNRNESIGYLTSRNVPGDQHARVLDFTYGHPLALALVADLFAQRPTASFRPDDAPDMIRILLTQFVQKVPSPAHRAALEACALVRLTSEALLSAMLNMPDVNELFEWLRDLSFIEQGSHGLFPHDMVREALDRDLRWRNPAWYAELHRRARTFYAAHLHQGSARQQQRVLIDYIFLHRHNPVVRPFFEWREGGNLAPDAARASDWPHILGMIGRHEGAEAVQAARHWQTHQPEGLLVLRAGDGQPAGFLWMIALQRATAIALEADPATRVASQYLQEHAALQPDEEATLFRFWMASDTYQEISVVQSLLFVHVVSHYLTTPNLAYTLFPCAEPAFWADVFAYADLQRIPAADYLVGERQYGVYGHDWRAVPPVTWLALLAEREVANETEALAPAPQITLPAVALGEEAFANALREGLRDLARSDLLTQNPLVRSRMVNTRVGAQASTGERVAALQALIREASDLLQASPRDLKAYRALYHTYLQPAATQEQAAELLDLPFSTFRRHLKEGLQRLTAILWQNEMQAG